MPPARQGMPTPSSCVCSTFGRSLQAPQRRSSPNHDTTKETEPQFGSSVTRCSSEVAKSVRPEAVWTLAETLRPGASAICTGVVASPYSPVPGIIATARTA